MHVTIYCTPHIYKPTIHIKDANTDTHVPNAHL